MDRLEKFYELNNKEFTWKRVSMFYDFLDMYIEDYGMEGTIDLLRDCGFTDEELEKLNCIVE